MNLVDKKIGAALRHDPLANAERMTGKSYKEDKATEMLGLLSHIEHGKRTEAMLLAADDTTFCNKLDRYERIIHEEGFEKVLDLPFTAEAFGAVRDEHLLVYFHRADTILLCFDTYGGDSVNGGSFAYNVQWNEYPEDSPESQAASMARSSGGWHKSADGVSVYAGSHDCREGLRFHIRQIRRYGQFVSPWLADPTGLHILDYGFLNSLQKQFGQTWPQAKLDAIRDEERRRLLLLPDYVQTAIAPSIRKGAPCSTTP